MPGIANIESGVGDRFGHEERMPGIANIESDEDILAAIAYIKEHCEKIGRKIPPEVICSGTFSMRGEWSAQEALDNFAHLQTLGISGSGTGVWTDSRSEWCENVLRFGEEVIAKLD